MLDEMEGDWESVNAHERMMPCRERMVEVYKITMSYYVMDKETHHVSPSELLLDDILKLGGLSICPIPALYMAKSITD